MNQRMKWDAEAAFKSLNAQGKRRQASIDDERLKTTPYTPPPNVAAWLQAQADKPKAGRDIASLMRYHEAHKKGVTDDDALRAKYGAVTCAKCGVASVGIHYCTTGQPTPTPVASAPPPPHSADGGQPLPSASTKPHGKDVDTADGGTPLIGMFGVERLWFGGMEYLARSRAMPCRRDAAMRWWQNTRTPTIPEMCSWLEQNGHADVAAQLRVTPRDDVATGGGRVWKDKYNGWHGVWLNGRSFGKSATCASFEDITASRDLPEDTSAYEVELLGPERDAIVAECRKAMGL